MKIGKWGEGRAEKGGREGEYLLHWLWRMDAAAHNNVFTVKPRTPTTA